MKDLLRKCYQEAEIKGANAILFENRATAIQQILNDEDFFEKKDWMLLTKWAIGALNDDAVEKHLIDLEEAFCKTDDRYTNENTKELHILVEVLLYQYCMETENILLPSIIVCGYGVGWVLRSKLLYGKFLNFTEEARLALRRLNQKIFAGMVADAGSSLRAIEAQPETEEDEEDGNAEETDEERVDRLETALEKAESRLLDLERKNQVLTFTLSVQREESDILWWMLAEWSETCRKSYHDMNADEAALFSAYELSSNISFPLGPYASKEIMAKMISLCKTKEREASSVAAMIDGLEESLSLSFEGCKITEMQPLLVALSSKENATKNGNAKDWRSYYGMRCRKDLDGLLLTAVDFGRQLYLEIELGRQLCAEGDGE